ncbi:MULTISPECIES: hypothetical protein [Anaerococcus]|uniref:hypothetical protein n=1 Tax=Anaerococcus TaxID=165779 RepID=UPI001AE2B222|nr:MULTISPECIES: hypothetical protein [Anaerococcus]MBP2069209.1 hypothetical protein [Anaerococcus nagyae]MDU3210855.1 hypothetical protein [Anaerococcus sp.]
MKKVWRLIVAIASVLYIILLIKKVDMTRSTYVILMGIVFMNQAVEEWDRYVETNKKIHLFIPIVTVGIIIFLIVQLL